MNYIFGANEFRDHYLSLAESDRNNIFILVKTSDGQEIYLKEYKQWLTISDYCSKMDVRIDSVSLKFRSHVVTKDTKGFEGVYVVRTAKGKMGGETKHCYSIGTLKNGLIKRTLWSTPELVEDMTFEDSVEDCIRDALVTYDNQAKNRKK